MIDAGNLAGHQQSHMTLQETDSGARWRGARMNTRHEINAD